MCGIVGLFVGCPLEDVCPKSQIAKQLKTVALQCQQEKYVSNLDDWDTFASVRTRPHRVLDTKETGVKSYFSSKFVPIARHSLVQSLPEHIQQEIRTQHLYRYLEFTSKLEHVVVNNVAMAIAQRFINIELPEQMTFDAYKLYCDEAYHAYFSVDLLRQVTSQSHLTPKLLEWPNFIIKLREIQHALPDRETQQLAEIFFVIISETLISSTLVGIPQDGSIVHAVRDVVKDHALDEGRHHQYFAQLLYMLWPRLSVRQRKIIGPLLPDLIFSFLTPDIASIRYELQSYNLPEKHVEAILEETYTKDIIVESTKQSSRATLMHLMRAGVLEEPETKEAFVRSGLVSTT